MDATLFSQLIRYHLQGERPGMHAGEPGTALDLELAELLYPDRFLWSGIRIQEQVPLADVSFWQGDIDFVRMKEAAIAGVIIRAGQRNWADTRFKANWTKAKAAGLPRGSYWFYDSREDPIRQAELWWSLIEDDPGELVLVADLEESYGGPFGERAHFKQFIRRILELSGLTDDRLVIYTGFYWWLKRVGDDAFFARFALWLAWYAAMSFVRVPPPWTEADLVFWQYTSSGDGFHYGVSSREIDLNWYCCSLIHFNNRFRLTSTPPPPPTNGGTLMDYWELKSNSTSSRSIRSGPGVKYSKLTTNGDLFAGKIAKAGATAADVHVFAADVPDAGMPTGYAARAGDTWRKVFEVDGRPTSGWIAKIHLGQTMITETFRGTTPPPDPDPEPQPSPQEETVITQTFTPPVGYVVESTVNGNTVTTVIKPQS